MIRRLKLKFILTNGSYWMLYFEDCRILRERRSLLNCIDVNRNTWNWGRTKKIMEDRDHWCNIAKRILVSTVWNYARSHTRTHSHTCTNVHAYTNTHIHKHTRIHARTHMQILVYTCVSVRVYVQQCEAAVVFKILL